MSTVFQVDAMTSGSTWRGDLFDLIRRSADGDVTSQSQTRNTRIQKVPVMMRGTDEYFEKYFVPRVVSFGPYHHDNDKLKSAETLKLKFTKEFFDGRQAEMMIVYDRILANIKTLRDCYDEEPTNEYDDEALAQMLFVDGCSVLYYISCHLSGGLYDWTIKDRRVAFVYQDLFLLENQLPFHLLQLLMMSAKYDTRWEGKEVIEDFIRINIETLGKQRQQRQRLQRQREEPEPSHLLDLLRKRLTGTTDESFATSTEVYRYHRQKKGIQSEHILICNVTELTAGGIHVKPSNTNYLSDVSFKRHWISGHLKLPPTIIDHSTKPKFLNLIAYEMCPNVINDFEVTSYVCFLALLINHSDDVKILRAAQTLHNFLDSDEEVAKLFKEIAADLVPNPFVYRHVEMGIGRYLSARGRAKMASWLDEAIRVYFRSPWTTIAVLAGFIAISVSTVQTYFTIFPLPDKCNASICKYIQIHGLGV